MRTSTLILGGAVGIATLWTAGWFVGRTLYVEPEADKVVEQLRSGDLFFSFDKRAVGGFPFAYEVTYEGVGLSDSSSLWRWSAGSLSVGSGISDGGALLLVPADQSKLTIEAAAFGGEPDDVPAVFDVLTDALSVRLTQGDGSEDVLLSATVVQLDQVSGAGLISDAKFRFGDLSVEIAMAEAGRKIASTIVAAEFENAYTMSADGVTATTTSGLLTGLRATFEADPFTAGSFNDFLAADGSGSLTIAAESYDATASSTGGPSAMPFAVVMGSGPSELLIAISEGRGSYKAQSTGVSYRSTGEGASAFPEGTVTIGTMVASLDMPLRKAPEPVPYKIDMTFGEIALDEKGWEQIDPAGAIAHTPLSAIVDLGGVVRVLTDLGGDSFGQPPVDVETLDINEISLSGLGFAGKANGTLNIAGNASQPDGDIAISLTGVYQLLDQLVAGGLVAEEQASAYRAIISTYAKTGTGADELIADISVADGAVSINGQPLQ